MLIGLGTWVFIGTLLLSRWWYANPDFFPRLPDSFWDWLDKLLNVQNVDGKLDVEFIVVVSLALLAVLVATALIAAVYRHARKDSR